MPTKKGISSISAIAKAQAHFAKCIEMEYLSAENLNSMMPKIKQGSWRGNQRKKYSPATPSADEGRR
jgi:hypothetical protein